MIDRARHEQRVVDPAAGPDCFRAAMSVVLDVPNGDHLPNRHVAGWPGLWARVLSPLGLYLEHRRGCFPRPHRWLAVVPSEVWDGGHAVAMLGGDLLFDPCPGDRRVEVVDLGTVRSSWWVDPIDPGAFDSGALNRWRAAVEAVPAC